MNVFVTGGSGTIGSAVIPALRGRGHTVTALARSDDSAAKVEAAGATAVRGELTDSEVLRDAAAAADATIHVGSPGDETSPEVDRVAAAAMQEGAGPEGTYVHTGGIWVYGNTEGEVDEDAPQDPPPLVAWRESVETEVLGRGNASLVIPAVVYGRTPGLLELTFGPGDDGVGRFPGDGAAHCTAVHVDDIGALYAIVVEQPAGVRVLGVAESAPVRAIAEALSPQGEARAEPAEELEARLGPMAAPMSLDQKVSNARARAFGWEPRHVNLLASLGRTER